MANNFNKIMLVEVKAPVDCFLLDFMSSLTQLEHSIQINRYVMLTRKLNYFNHLIVPK
jgi:hypothetical protein